MQSVLILGKNTDKLREEALKLAREEGVSKFDIENIQSEKALGITEIRNLQKNIFLMPLQGDKKAAILEAFYGITNEAQNAFLKLLEEPPQSSIIIILTTSLDFVLPTILSRCTLIKIDDEKTAEKDLEKNFEIFREIQSGKVKNGFLYAQNFGKSREEALSFLEGLITACERNLEKDNSLFKSLKEMQETYSVIKTTNVSPRFALENLFLSI